MYKPLPKQLTIKNSPIEGLGLYAQEDIKKGTFIGITHDNHNNTELSNNRAKPCNLWH